MSEPYYAVTFEKRITVEVEGNDQEEAYNNAIKENPEFDDVEEGWTLVANEPI